MSVPQPVPSGRQVTGWHIRSHAFSLNRLRQPQLITSNFNPQLKAVLLHSLALCVHATTLRGLRHCRSTARVSPHVWPATGLAAGWCTVPYSYMPKSGPAGRRRLIIPPLIWCLSSCLLRINGNLPQEIAHMPDPYLLEDDLPVCVLYTALGYWFSSCSPLGLG